MKRIYHTWDKWECYPAGFYANKGPADDETCRDMYRDFLRNLPEFEIALALVLTTWPNSCEHYLSNESMNRIAWLGQAAMCIARGVPAFFRGGFDRLTPEEQEAANLCALSALNVWLAARGEDTHTLETVKSKTEANLY